MGNEPMRHLRFWLRKDDKHGFAVKVIGWKTDQVGSVEVVKVEVLCVEHLSASCTEESTPALTN